MNTLDERRSERRIRVNHMKRRRELRKHILTLVLTFRTCHYLFDDVLYGEDESSES